MSIFNSFNYTKNIKYREKANNVILSKAINKQAHIKTRMNLLINRYNSIKRQVDRRTKLAKKINELKKRQKKYK